MIQEVCAHEESTLALARRVASSLAPSDNVLLIGSLGAGKTFFVRALLRLWGIDTTIPSPSYTLIQEYRVRLHGSSVLVRHIDLYRIDTEADLRELGLKEMLAEEGMIFIEWADKFPLWFEKAAKRVDIKVLPDGSRSFTVSGCD